MVMLHRSARLATVAIGVLVSVSEAFLSGAPGPRSKLPTPSKPESKTRVDDLESRSSSPFNAEVINIEQPPIKPQDPVPESELTTMQAKAIALEAATSKTVPKSTILQALNVLAHSEALPSSFDVDPASVTSVGSIDGVWRLRFCEGDFLQGITVDRHGYLGRDQQVDVLFDVAHERIVLGSRGLRSSLPKVVQGGLAYAPETNTAVGYFDKESVGIDSLVLHTCLVDEDALGFHTSLQGKDGYLLFQAENSKAALARLSEQVADLSSEDAAGKKAATVAVAGTKKLDLPNVGNLIVSVEDVHDDKRLAVEETGRNTGSFNTFIRYLETEGATIYAVLAGPVIFSFIREYSPIAATKATAAALVLAETIHHYLEVST